ncbi:MAG: dephospho-CoA kinase [Elusimicrobia bacterium]|nr:MAG: dephospho-CoA kinase [Elusimicrobiota bacterium]KAF0154418.1 MAG: dephospho-CoA kinase [Elusimicrobiota bacterium]
MRLSTKAAAGLAALRRRKLLVGLTGPIGAGKSAALEEFARLGAFTVSADELARAVLTSPACYSRISKQFGPRVFLPDGSLDRKKLAAKVFRDRTARKKLESLLHPLIIEETIALISTTPKKTAIVDAPLLFETGLERHLHLTVCVTAPGKTRRRRCSGRGWPQGEFEARERAQLPAGEKEARADITLDNSGSRAALRARVKTLYGFLKITAER